uniref:Translocon of the chloroplast inner membrane protein n=1 Tax=Amorphochlora amoebiformis TaxID=1561963 RepID=A0A0H5BII4_9EUKA|nr:translocon of the chloroplast inner membrane protein [Amorphochlora amoebiformis]|mmetsp:Transcript_13971/g.22114  ORF Transcript_13971/g.22114 Transcript_13971/m.22114 type:complete len:208 (+) Transcript_13971:244-867(+)
MTTLHNLLNSNLAKQNIAINTKRKIHFFRNLNLFKKNDRIYTIFAKRFKKERKTVKFLRLKCTSLYLYPLINVIFFGRNVINDFPGNLFIYQLLALPTLYIFKSTFLLIFFYIGLIAGIVYNRRIDKTVRSHAALSNFLDISLLIFLISKSIFPPYFKWSIAQPLLDCILYTFYVGCTIYCLVYASMGKVPTLPKSIQKVINEILSF